MVGIAPSRAVQRCLAANLDGRTLAANLDVPSSAGAERMRTKAAKRRLPKRVSRTPNEVAQTMVVAARPSQRATAAVAAGAGENPTCSPPHHRAGCGRSPSHLRCCRLQSRRGLQTRRR